MVLPSQSPEETPKCYCHFGEYEYVRGDCDTCFWGYSCLKGTEIVEDYTRCIGCAYEAENKVLRANCVGCHGHANRPHKVPAGPDAPSDWWEYKRD
jgi:hypothetical protein